MSAYPYQLKQEPLALLGTLADRSDALQMSHTYRGLLVTTEISLMKLYNNRAVFHGPCSQIGIKPGDQILLHSPSSQDTLAGRVLEINHHQCMLSIGELVGMEHPWSERGEERVQAPEPVRVFLRSGNCGLPTFLENLSLTGAGLLAYKPAEHGLELRPDQAVRLDFKLPHNGGHYSLSGRVANVDHPSPFLALLGVTTYPSAEQARQLERYITHRKAEILDEINYSFNGFFETHKVTNLYF